MKNHFLHIIHTYSYPEYKSIKFLSTTPIQFGFIYMNNFQNNYVQVLQIIGIKGATKTIKTTF